MIGERSSALKMLNDPDEGPFLRAIICGPVDQPVDDAVWLRYAELLESRNDQRGELLRLDRALFAQVLLDEFTSADQTRYRQLSHLLSTTYATWMEFVTRNHRTLNCGKASLSPLMVRFQFECPNRWETMAMTAEAGVRFCADCERKVYFCDSAESVERRARAGDCITVRSDVVSSVHAELTEHITGMPDLYQLWGERIFR